MGFTTSCTWSYAALVALLTAVTGLCAPAQQQFWGQHLSGRPDVFSAMSLQISYKGHTVNNGSELSPSYASEVPEVNFDGAETYTLMLIDPDVPSPKKPVNRNFVHWLVTNIPKDSIDNGQTVFEYAPPAPPPGTGFHRYIFKLYGQGQDTIQVKAPESRAKFSPEDFAKQYDLGESLASFFFKAEHEETIEE